jgi:hypothetical protein
MLGDKLIDIPVYVIVGILIISLLLLVSLSLIRKFFPKLEQSIDYILLSSGKVILFIMKLSFLIIFILLVGWYLISH